MDPEDDGDYPYGVRRQWILVSRIQRQPASNLVSFFPSDLCTGHDNANGWRPGDTQMFQWVQLFCSRMVSFSREESLLF